jgi:hypothetical protein
VLAKLGKARAMLIQATDLQQVKKIRDQAKAIEAYMKEQEASEDLVRRAGEIQAWAERRLGELLRDEEKNKGGKPAKNGLTDTSSSKAQVSTRPSLSDLGICRKLSSRAQTLASIPEKKFEAILADQKKELSVGRGSSALNIE